MQHINPSRKPSWRAALPLLALFLATLALSAQPVLVKDINANTESGGNSTPTHLCNVNGTLFFVAEDGTNGAELWKSDGTEAGTVLVRNIHPSTSGKGPHSLTNVNGTLYFVADDGASGNELWKSDGTAAGTVRLKDIENSTFEFDYDIANLTDVNGTLFFTAFQRQTGWELWKSNGTEAGTVLVKNINPLYDFQQKAGNGSNPNSFAVLDGTLYFMADNGASGVDLWKSDGTEAGTVLVTDFPGPVSSVSGVGGALYLLVQDGAGGTQLWKSNGTEAGAVFLGKFSALYNNYFSRFVVIGNVLYFAADDGTWGTELWRSDGTQAGTVLVRDLLPGVSSSYPNGLVSFNGTLYFTANHPDGRRDVWKSDGTEAGTVPLQDMTDFSGGFHPGSLMQAGNALYFDGYHPEHGRELWKSDGKATGTAMVKNIGPGWSSSNPYYLTDVNGTLYFTATDGNEVELWKSDGTEAGTMRVKNIRPGSGNAWLSRLTDVNGTLFFVSGSAAPGPSALWKSNGTAATTQLLRTFAGNPYNQPSHLTDVNGTLYFTAEDQGSGLEVWKSDGTPAGTVLLKDIFPGFSGSSPSDLVNAGGTLYFSASDGSGSLPQLWKSDGTAAGTVRVQHPASAVQAALPQNLVAVAGKVFFTASGHYGRELWKSDGTAAGTVQVKDISPGTADAFSWYGTNGARGPWLVALNGTVFFVADDGVHGNELWKSDGTEAGTVLVKDIYPGPTGTNAYNLTAVNGTLYLAADDGVHGYELWKSDGTEAGTVLVKDTWPGPGSSSAFFQLVDVNGTLFFNAMAQYPSGFNTKIWKSDGTPEGTILIDKPSYEWAFNLAAVNDVLYFNASDFSGINAGNELWRTDGTVAGTSLVYDLAPGQASSVPENLTNAGKVLYFTANDGTHGNELWKYNPAACPAPDAALAVMGSTVCRGNPATVQVKRVQPGVTYRLYLGNNPVGDARTGTGDLTFTLPADLLVAATYVLQVRAAGCTEVVLAQSALVQVLDPVAAPVAAGVAIRAGDAALLTAGGAPAGSTYRWYAAAAGGNPLATGAAFTTPNLWAKATYYVSVYRVAGCESARTPVTVVIAGGSQFRVNAGGEVFTSPEGKVFAADTYFSGGRVAAVTAGEVAGTPADALYRNQRVGEFAYQLPTGNGQFDVTLHFNETYWGNLAAGGIGSRRFHVAIEGSARLTDYDIFAKAGGAMRAVTETFRVTVTDGTLNIHFSKGLADNPSWRPLKPCPSAVACG
jgi:ELWxxDGT repeat protein